MNEIHTHKKKIRAIAMTISISMILMILAIPTAVIAKEKVNTELHSRAAVLIDGHTGRVLVGKNENLRLPMASTTKIMTCILALEYGNVNDVVNVSTKAVSMPKVKLGMSREEKFYLKDLLYSLMLESHNDTAVAIAEHIGGSTEGFAVMMNEKAKELGCFDTSFVTPNGLDDQKHFTTAKDLAKILSYCINESKMNKEFLKITRTKNHTFCNVKIQNNKISGGIHSYSCNNHNAFLDMMDGALTGKTGFTGNAGYCYVGALERDDRQYIVALLACGWPGNKSYKWRDTRKLMEYGIENYTNKNLIDVENETQIVKNVNVIVENANVNMPECTIKIPVNICDFSNNIRSILVSDDDKITAELRMEKTISAPVNVGRRVGSIIYKLNGKIINEKVIVTNKNVGRADYSFCAKSILENALNFATNYK